MKKKGQTKQMNRMWGEILENKMTEKAILETHNILMLTCAVAWRIFVKSSFISSTVCSKIFSGSSKELIIAFAYDCKQERAKSYYLFYTTVSSHHDKNTTINIT
jgi:hypothetical protein